jgi:hypothetical protein
MRICLVLGCWGRKHDNFQVCCGVENEILDLTDNSERNTAISKRLDDVYRLFDRPLYNNVHTAIFNLQDNFSQQGQPLFSKEFFIQLEGFCIMHTKCGLFLRLRLKESQ